ncbi:MAG TPA: ABC transporter substrate-binding protein [Spirochaetia bacterium]|nr:ABC transporter substrate-binding protein [Spirochaetia bacterium]
MRNRRIRAVSVAFRVAAGSLLFVAAGQQASAAPLLSQAPANFNDLVKAAQKEGQLTVIALPHNWLNYGEAIDTFAKKYGIKVNELNPDAGSGDELQAVQANKDNMGPQAPDVIDVGFSFGPDAKKAGILAPYKVRTWSTIPASVKDPDGYWYGDYYGVMAFEVNLDVVKNPPLDWADLLGTAYKGQIALTGDPRVSNQAIMAVAAANLANKGTFDNAQPGVDFFAKLNAQGNFVPLIAKMGTIATGETPVAITWDYLALTDRDTAAGNPNIGVFVPTSGVLAGVYVQGISAYAPHPNAARLWEEFLYSDEGQLIWLKGYGHPIRYADLASRNAIPDELASKLPPASYYAKAVFPTLAQQGSAKAFIVSTWDSIVGANVTAKQ